MNAQTKTLTVTHTRYPARPNAEYGQRERIVPRIRLRGQWLADAGFIVGAKYTATLNADGAIVLRLEGGDDGNA